MKRILITCAGGPAGLNLTRALRAAPERVHLIGVDAERHQVHRAETDEVHLAPSGSEPDFVPVLRHLVHSTGADMVWPCDDREIAAVSGVDNLGAKTFLPPLDVVHLCQDKMACCARMADAGVPVPSSMRIHTPEDLRRSLAVKNGTVWLRAVTGTGGRGALRITEAEFEKAKTWINLHHGWGSFMAAEWLPGKSVTWEAVWQDGHRVFSQANMPLYWEHSNLALGGVTGIVGAFQWVADPEIDAVGETAVEAVAGRPHGVFTVDMTYDAQGRPRVTEINAGRFAQAGVTIFAQYGVNAASCATRLTLERGLTIDDAVYSPYPTDVVVIRGIDVQPVIRSAADIEARRFDAPFHAAA